MLDYYARARRMTPGVLFPAWQALFSGANLPWCTIHRGVREDLAYNRLSKIGELVDQTLASKGADRDSILGSIWYTVVICAHQPIQVGLPLSKVSALVRHLANKLEKVCDPWVEKEVIVPLTRGSVPQKENLLHLFPRKSHPLAGRKANLFLDKMLEDLWTTDPTSFPAVCRVFQCIKPGAVTDDQMCSALLYADSVRPWFGFEFALRVAVWSVLQPEDAGKLSDLLKATGVNGMLYGAQLCELKTLQGRGVNACDLRADARRRLKGSLCLPLVHVDPVELGEVVDQILDEELQSDVNLPSVAQFWAERFRWCVGGSHNMSTNRHWQGENPHVGCGAGMLRWNRRAACEVTEGEPLSAWTGRVEVSVAEKLEHGKGRAIYSCDTLSYIAFTWLLRPVEEAWASKRVILDPGKDGALGMVNRIRGLSARFKRPVYTMLDYSDFNSQHTLEAQRVVIQRVLNRVHHNEPELADKLVASFDNMHIRMDGKIIGQVGGSLMSGHRGTTFLNSVLNSAYVRLALGTLGYEHAYSLHVGDDVLMVVNSEEAGWRIALSLERFGCTLQTSKQSIGRQCFEFLRMAGSPEYGCHGYTARSVAGLVSGNWVTEYRSGPLAALHSLIQQARSIINRSGNASAWRLMLRSASSITGVETAILGDLLSGEVAAAPGPCYRTDGRYLFRYVEEVAIGRQSKRRPVYHDFPTFASRDYIEQGVHPLEREGIKLAGTIPWNAMALSSFRAMELSYCASEGIAVQSYKLVFSGVGVRLKQGQTRASDVHTTAKRHGLLAHLPILSLLKNVLRRRDVEQLLASAGVDYDRENPMISAWGGSGEGTTVRGFIPYSDAAGCAERILGSALLADICIRM